MSLASRMSRIGESATLRVARRAIELRARGVSLVDMGAGEPDFDSPPEVVEAARRALADGFTRYTPGSGLPALREELAERFRRLHGTPWTAANSIVTVGGKAALFELSQALYEPGSQVVIPSPCWVSFPEQVRFAGAEPVFVPTSGDDGFRVHAGAVLDAVTDRTSVILLNSPSNPTGGVVAPDDLRAIVEVAAERGLTVVSDETYERFVYDGSPRSTVAELAAEFPDTVVLVGSFSKSYAMTGWRIGYALGPLPVIRACEQVQSHMTSNATSFAMVGALEALRSAEPAVERMIAAYQERRDFLVPRLNRLPGFECRPPDGAFYAFPKVSGCYDGRGGGSVAFADFLLEKAGVVVVPGAPFGSDDHIRLSFACSLATLAEGVERIAAVLTD